VVISNSRKFVFVHTPKTGGTSMTYALQEVIGWNDIVCGGTRYGRRLKDVWGEKWGIGKHAPATEIRSLIGRDRWEQYFTFALVRHPIERARSMYQWTKRIVERQGWRRWARFILSRYQQDLWKWPTVAAYLDTDGFSGYIRHPRFEEARISNSQHWYLSGNADEEIIVDQVYSIENLDSEIDKIAEKIDADLKKEKRNVSSYDNSRKICSIDKDYLEKMYKKDFDLVGVRP